MLPSLPGECEQRHDQAINGKNTHPSADDQSEQPFQDYPTDEERHDRSQKHRPYVVVREVSELFRIVRALERVPEKRTDFDDTRAADRRNRNQKRKLRGSLALEPAEQPSGDRASRS